MNAQKRLATKLIKLREEKNLNRTKLGRMIGVTSQAIYNIETCRSWVAADTLDKLANAFGVDVADLFAVSDRKHADKKITVHEALVTIETYVAEHDKAAKKSPQAEPLHGYALRCAKKLAALDEPEIKLVEKHIDLIAHRTMK